MGTGYKFICVTMYEVSDFEIIYVLLNFFSPLKIIYEIKQIEPLEN